MNAARGLSGLGPNAWAYVPLGLLVSLVGLELWMVRSAVSDPAFSVEDDYYARAVSWSAKMEQDRENVRLGFRVGVDVTPGRGASDVRVTLANPDGSPVAGATVTAEAFFVARAHETVRANLSEAPDGTYRGALAMKRPGLWEIRLTSVRGADRFTHVVRRDIGAQSP